MNPDTPETESIKDFSQPEKLLWKCQQLERQRDEYRVQANRYQFLHTLIEVTRSHDGVITGFSMDWRPEHTEDTLGTTIDFDLAYLKEDV